MFSKIKSFSILSAGILFYCSIKKILKYRQYLQNQLIIPKNENVLNTKKTEININNTDHKNQIQIENPNTLENNNSILQTISKSILKRNYQFFTEPGMEKIRSSHIVIINTDSIGSNCALALVRSGISKLTLIDNSFLTPYSFITHPIAIYSDISKSNNQLIEFYAKKILPDVKIDSINKKFNTKIMDNLTKQNLNYVIDCSFVDCDLDMKCEIIKYCYDNKINIISSLIPRNKVMYDSTKVCVNLYKLIHDCEECQIFNDFYVNKYNQCVPNIYFVYYEDGDIDNNVDINCNHYNNLNLIYRKQYNFNGIIYLISSQILVSHVLREIAEYNPEKNQKLKMLECNKKKDMIKKENKNNKPNTNVNKKNYKMGKDKGNHKEDKEIKDLINNEGEDTKLNKQIDSK